MSEKLSQSKVSGRFCNVKSEPLPEDIQDKLEKASKAANGKIRRNNKVYYMLTKYVCYLIAQNGNSKKEENKKRAYALFTLPSFKHFAQT